MTNLLQTLQSADAPSRERRLAVFLFDVSGVAGEPFLDAGWDVLCFDIQHGIRKPKLPHGIWCDLSTVGPVLIKLAERGYTPADIDFLGCFPPCTDVGVCGARDFKMKGLRALQQATGYFATCQELAALCDCPGFIENPVSSMASHWRKPDHYFSPHQFTEFCRDDNYTKKTSLWTFGGFVMPEENKAEGLPPPDDRIHKASPGDKRGDVRSVTPRGFVRAAFAANFKALEAEAQDG